MMANRLDEITGRPIGEWRISPPEIHVAENGYVLRTYDVVTDQVRYRIASTADEVKAALHVWVDEVAAQIKSATERHLASAGIDNAPASDKSSHQL